MGLQFINMLAWWQWVMLAAVPPAIVLLYFLKLKRQPLEVPSTYLWRKSIEDLHVNSIWQRLRKNLLLLLQLAILLLVMLALLRPSWRGAALQGDRFIFLIDNSASMSTADALNGARRLDEAKRQVGALIEQMTSGDTAMLISFADNAQVVQEFTSNRRQLLRRLEAIQPTQRGTSLLTALQLAAGLANPGRSASSETDEAAADPLPADLFIFSDGRFPEVQGFSLGNLEPHYIPIGKPDTPNLAVTAFGTRRHESRAGVLQAFGQIENFGEADAQTTVELRRGAELLDAAAVEIPADGSAGVAFELTEDAAGSALTLVINAPDALALDNRAYAVMKETRKRRVLLVTPGNFALEQALSTNRALELAEISTLDPGALKSKTYQDAADLEQYDLILYDQCAPERMPQANTLFIGRVPPHGAWSAESPAETIVHPQILDVEQSHPLMHFVELANIEIAESLSVTPPPGSTTLIDSSRGKLFAIGPRDGFEDAVLGFELYGSKDGETYVNTNWPLRLSFPTFMHNALEYLGGRSEVHAMGSARPGEIVTLRSSAPTDRLQVRTPSGETVPVLRGKRNEFQFNRAEEVGVYEVREDGRVTQQFAVNLFDSSESDVRTRSEEAILIGHVEVRGKTEFEPTRKETWQFLLILALVVLLSEWYIYNRRVYL